MASETLALEMRGIRKYLGRREVLRGVDLSVRQGETVAVLGPNGSGKTTLLRIAATLSRSDKGSVQIAGLDAMRDAHLARRNLSLLTQAAPVYAELTPHEHLAWWARMQGLPRDAQATEQATLQSGLAASAHKPAGTLSRGQQQRLALAMALLPKRPLLILDEPFSALDALGHAWVEAELQSRRPQHACLLALHDEAQARRLADRVVRFEHGRLVEAAA